MVRCAHMRDRDEICVLCMKHDLWSHTGTQRLKETRSAQTRVFERDKHADEENAQNRNNLKTLGLSYYYSSTTTNGNTDSNALAN